MEVVSQTFVLLSFYCYTLSEPSVAIRVAPYLTFSYCLTKTIYRSLTWMDGHRDTHIKEQRQSATEMVTNGDWWWMTVRNYEAEISSSPKTSVGHSRNWMVDHCVTSSQYGRWMVVEGQGRFIKHLLPHLILPGSVKRIILELTAPSFKSKLLLLRSLYQQCLCPYLFYPDLLRLW